MNYKAFTLGCITVIIIVLIVIAFIYPNTIYDSSMILLTALSSIAWVILYISTRTLHCVQNENPKKLICEIKGSGRKYKIKGGIKGGINTNYYNTITGGIDFIPDDNKKDINDLITLAKKDNKELFYKKWNTITILKDIDCTRQQDVSEMIFTLFGLLEKPGITSLINSIKDEETLENTEPFYVGNNLIDLNDIKFNNLHSIKELIITNFIKYLQNKSDNKPISVYMNPEFIYTELLQTDNIYIDWFDKLIPQLTATNDKITELLKTKEFKNDLNRNIIRLLSDGDGISIIEFYYSNLYKSDPYILLSIDNILLSSEFINTTEMTKKFNILDNLDILNNICNKMLLDKYEIIGINKHIGKSYRSGHYIAHIKHEDTIYECDDKQIIPSNTDFNTLISDIDDNYNNPKLGYPKIKTILFKRKNIPYVTNPPVGLHNFGVTCFANSVFQLLMATNLLNKTPATTQTPTTPVQQPALTPASTQEKAKYLIGIIYTPDGKFYDQNEQNYADYKNIMDSKIYNNITKPTLVIYNENFTQYANKDINPGVGNDIIRPLRSDVTNPTNNNNLYVLGIPISDPKQDKQIDAKAARYEDPINNIINLINDKKIEVVIFYASKYGYTIDIKMFDNKNGLHLDASSNKKYYFDMLIEKLGNDFKKYYFTNGDPSLTYISKDVQRLQSLQKLLTTSTPVDTPVQQQSTTPASTATPTQNVTTSTPQVPTSTAKTQPSTPAVLISATNKVTSKIDNIDIEIIIGDIFNVTADAIVNPANIQLKNNGGLALQIQTHYIPQKPLNNGQYHPLSFLSDQLKKTKDLFKTGDAIVTDASSLEWDSLRFTSIIHTPGPDFRKPADFGAESYADKIDTGKEKLKDCMFNIMDQANKNEVVTDIVNNTFIKQTNQNLITSISIPMISSAIFAGKLNTEDLHKSIGKKYIEGILEYLNTNPPTQNIKKINFVIYDDKKNPSDSKSYFNNFINGFNEGINEYNNKTTKAPAPASTPAPTTAPVQQPAPTTAPVQLPAQTAAQKEAQKEAPAPTPVQQNKQVQPAPVSTKTPTKTAQTAAKKEVPQALNTIVDENLIKKWNDIIDQINSYHNNKIDTNLINEQKEYAKYNLKINNNETNNIVFKTIINKLYKEQYKDNNYIPNGYLHYNKENNRINYNLNTYKFYYLLFKDYISKIKQINNWDGNEYKRLINISGLYNSMTVFVSYMDKSFDERMLININNLSDKFNKDNAIHDRLPLEYINIIKFIWDNYIDSVDNTKKFNLVFKLIEWKYNLESVNLNISDELIEDELIEDELIEDNFKEDKTDDDDNKRDSLFYIQRKPIREVINNKFINIDNGILKNKQKLRSMIIKKAKNIYMIFTKQIDTTDHSINIISNKIQNFINFINNPPLLSNDMDDDFEISDPYTSYSSSYSSDNIKKISKRYGTDNTSFDKFYKELLHSEIL